MPFTYNRTIRFQETDAAGVMYFSNVLNICHEAYEASLTAAGITLDRFFRNPTVAVPIVHASVDFLRPSVCGDGQVVQLTPSPLTPDSFEIVYKTFAESNPATMLSKAVTRHVCIHPISRQKQPLSHELKRWLQCWGHSV